MPMTLLILNRDARMGNTIQEALRPLCKERAIVCSAVRRTDVERALQAALESGAEEVIVGGGDGTLRTAAQLLAGSRVRLGILPLGTTNNLARSLDIPLDWRAALEGALTWEARRIPLGAANRQVFVHTASIGASVTIARLVDASTKHVLGRFAYPWTGLRALRLHRPFLSTITPEGAAAFRHRTYQLIISNGRTLAGFAIYDPGAIHDEELRLLSFSAQAGRWRSVLHFLSVLAGRSHRPGVLIERSASFHVETLAPMPVELDGEIRTKTPATFTTLPGALWVRMPTGNAK